MFSSGLTVASFIDKNCNRKQVQTWSKYEKHAKSSNRTTLVIKTNYELKDDSSNLETLENIKKKHLS